MIKREDGIKTCLALTSSPIRSSPAPPLATAKMLDASLRVRIGVIAISERIADQLVEILKAQLRTDLCRAKRKAKLLRLRINVIECHVLANCCRVRTPRC